MTNMIPRMIPRIEGMIEAFNEAIEETRTYFYEGGREESSESDYYTNKAISGIIKTLETKKKRLQESLKILKGDETTEWQ